MLLAGGAGFLNCRANQLFQFVQRERLGEEGFEDSNFLFFFARQFRASAFLVLFDCIAAFFNFLLDQDNDFGVGQIFSAAFNLGVADGGLEQAKGGEAVGVLCDHRGFEFLRQTIEQGHGLGWDVLRWRRASRT